MNEQVVQHNAETAALAALWKIRMEAERSTVDDDPAALVQRIIHLAEGGMAGRRREAQDAAHNDGSVDAD